MNIDKQTLEGDNKNIQQSTKEDDRQFEKQLVKIDEQMANESDSLVPNAIPCGQYNAIDNDEPIQLDDIDENETNPMPQQRKKQRRKRMRLLSQGSTAGHVSSRRPTYSGRVGKRSRRHQLCGPAAPPRHVHVADWREMLEITRRHDEDGTLALQPIHKSEEDLDLGEELRAVETTGDKFPSTGSLQHLATTGKGDRDNEVARMRFVSGGSSLQCDWIEQNFCKRECIQFIASSRDSNKCGCGRYRNQHVMAGMKQAHEIPAKRWSIQKHTTLAPTDAYGTVEFQGGPHPFKAQYLRLNFDSDPADIMCLFEHIWQIEPPKLIITIHGGITNFDLQPKLARVFRKGLLKAARTTGAWIFTSGINAGVVRQVAAALESANPSSKSNKIVSVGIAPWGLLKRREDFIGRDKVVLYHPQSFPPKSRFAVLNNRHSFFLLVDNGTIGRYGADIILRRRLESYIAEKQKIGSGNRSVPVVCVVLEGGTCTIRTVLDYVTTIPKVPVVICDGSGRASDLLAFAHQYVQEDGNLPEVIRPQLLSLIEDVFFYDKHNAQCLVMDILSSVRQRNLITVFRLGANQRQDVDYAILTALLKGHNLSAAEQLSLALAWNRVDIARSDIFIMGQDWPKNALHNAMMEALIHNRVDFVRLLLENGVSMHEFLTIARLEELYNTDQGPPNTLYYIVRDVVKIRAGYRYKLPHIGMAIEKLMANGFRSHYTSAQFRHKYSEYKAKLKENQRLHNQVYQTFQNAKFPASPSNYHRCGSEFFAPQGLRGGGATLPTSISESRLGFGKESSTSNPPTQPSSSRLNNVYGQTSPYPQNYHHNSNSNFAAIPTISGSRALSNHILWRTAYRRENNPAAPKQSTMSIRNASAKSPPPLTQSHSAFLGTLHERGGGPGYITEPIGYAAEADESLNTEGEQRMPDFRYPFSDLLVWAVLTKRHEMALCMWQHGEEAMAKALVACRLYKSLANEAAEDYLEVEVCEELKKYAEEFRQNSLDLLDHCYKQDDAQTLQLLTYELSYWGEETCLSLAVIVNNKAFLAHPCCQILLADLWHGGLRIRSNPNLKVILGIIFPPSIFLLEFKSREELMLQPQTAAEHHQDINDSSSSSSESSSSSSSSSESSESGDETADVEPKGISIADRRRASHGSVQSLNFTSIFQSKRKRHRPSYNPNSSTPGANDLEAGKAKTKDAGKSIGERKTRAKSRPGSSVLAANEKNSSSPIGGGGALAMAAQATLGTARAVAGNGVNPVPSPHHSPLQISPTEKRHQTSASPLHIDTANTASAACSSNQTPTRGGGKQFILGSIGENFGEKDEEIMMESTASTPKHPTGRNRNLDCATTNNDQYQSSTDNSPNHHAAAAANQKFIPAQPHWDLGRNYGLAKGMDHLSRLTANGGYVPKGIPLPEGVTLNKKRQIKFRRKLYEFFVAPITTFWAWTLSFVVFLSVLTYVLLVRTPSKPTLLEWYLLAYVVAFGIEITRKFLMSEPKKLREKFGYYFGNYWNFLTAVAIIGFIIGFIFRMNPSTSKSIGRIILAVDSVLWTVKLLDFLGVFPRFGPYITMAGKMIMSMSSIIVMLFISLLGFGLARQSITYPNEEWHWLLLRNVFYKPYFMLYGEVYADEIDTCGDEAWDEHLDKNVSIANAWTNRDDRDRELACVPGHWIPPILMTVFLVIANILLINMLIAIFNNIFESTNKISQQIWLFQRYRQVMEYEATPFLPPPFTPIYHAYMIFKYLNYRRCIAPRISLGCICFCIRMRKLTMKGDNPDEDPAKECCDEKNKGKPPPLAKNAFEQRRNLQQGRSAQERLAIFDFSLKLFLTEDQVEKLHDFEEECMEDLAREKEYERNRTSEERLHRTCERTELILSRVNDLTTKETMLKGNVRELETRIEMMENRQTEILDCLRQLTSVVPTMVQSLQSMQHHFPQQMNQSPYQTESNLEIHQTPCPAEQQPIDSQSSRRMMPARSEGHIFGIKDSVTKKAQEDGDGAALTTKSQLLPSISVDQSVDLATSPTTLLPVDTRQHRAHSYGSTLEGKKSSGGGIGSSPTSSISTVYYPLKGSGGGSSGGHLIADMEDMTVHKRNRTTTVGGGEFPGNIPESGGGTTNQHSRIFGSLISLDPNLVGQTSSAGAIQSRRNTQRRHRLNEEYTSITDTINVEELTAKLAEEEEIAAERHLEERKEPRYSTQVVDEEVQTEEEDEEDLEEEDEEIADEYENEEVSSSSRSPKRRSKSKIPSVAIEVDSASINFEVDTLTTRRFSFEEEDLDFGRSLGTEEGEFDDTLHRATTPNSTLRRARASFVRQQNTLLKNFEEDVGRPSKKLKKRTQNEEPSIVGKPHAASEEQHKKENELEEGNADNLEEFINFKAQSSKLEEGERKKHQE